MKIKDKIMFLLGAINLACGAIGIIQILLGILHSYVPFLNVGAGLLGLYLGVKYD